jgi:hypothetical protein
MECSEIGCNAQACVKTICRNHYDKKYFKKRWKTSPEIVKKQVKQSVTKRRKKAFEKFNNCCKICSEKPDWTLKKINLQFHHLYYEEGRTEYIKEIDGHKSNTNILKEVEECPERFELLCFECHKIVGIAKTQPYKIKACDEYILKSSSEK